MPAQLEIILVDSGESAQAVVDRAKQPPVDGQPNPWQGPPAPGTNAADGQAVNVSVFDSMLNLSRVLGVGGMLTNVVSVSKAMLDLYHAIQAANGAIGPPAESKASAETPATSGDSSEEVKADPLTGPPADAPKASDPPPSPTEKADAPTEAPGPDSPTATTMEWPKEEEVLPDLPGLTTPKASTGGPPAPASAGSTVPAQATGPISPAPTPTVGPGVVPAAGAGAAAQVGSKVIPAVAGASTVGPAASTATAASAGAMGAAAGASAILGPVAVVGAALLGAAASVKVFDSVMQAEAEKLKGLSAPVAQAEANAEIRSLLAEMRRAERIGPMLAHFTQDRNRLAIAIEEMKTGFLTHFLSAYEAFRPIIEAILTQAEMMGEGVKILGEVSAMISENMRGEDISDNMARIKEGLDRIYDIYNRQDAQNAMQFGMDPFFSEMIKNANGQALIKGEIPNSPQPPAPLGV